MTDDTLDRAGWTGAAPMRGEVRLRRAQELAHIGDWCFDVASQRLTWSDGLYRIFSLDPGEPISMERFLDRVHPDDRAALETQAAAGLPYRSDYRILLPGGAVRQIHEEVEIVRDPEGRAVRYWGTAQDLSELKASEQALRESEERYRSLFNQAGDTVLVLEARPDTIPVIVDANDAALRLHGYSREELLGKPIAFIDPDTTPEISAQRDRLLKENGFATFPVTHRRKDGTVLHAEARVQPVTIGGRRLLLSVERDVTARLRAEELLRQSEQFIRRILDTVDEGFIVIDREYRVVTANRAYCAQVSRPWEQVVGRRCYEVSHRAHQPCHESGEECGAMRVFATGSVHVVTHQHPDAHGGRVYVECKAFPIKDDSGAVISVIETINNITERHLLEEERLKTQKLESIGTLAGGIAHDFNNLLQGVFGYISVAKLSLDQREKSLAMLEQAEQALHQSVNLTTQLLTFSKGGQPVRKTISLLPVVENAVKFALSGSRSTYRLRHDPGLWPVEADGGQLAQVIQNIVLNADQAMPLGGSVLIDVRNLPARLEPQPASGPPQDRVQVSISDNGVGIPAAHLGRIFDPYFTTKEKGSGLGLATSYSIVRNHDGTLEVSSEEGRGTTFLISLPAAPAGVTPPREAAASTGRRTGRILLMDDEPIIREVAGELLAALGHTVEFAERGEAALEAYRRALAARAPFDVVILDLTIRGGMGGEETIGKLLALDPGVKAVVSSGYSDDSSLAEHRQHGFKAFLKKPYSIPELKKTLDELLEQGSAM